MVAAGSRLRQIGWAVVLTLCLVGFLALTFRVNAVKSEVRLAERQIIALKRQKLLLETEFETRANQQQLSNWNQVDFGYAAPGADQYLENERQLAALGVERDINAPSPIRVARAATEDEQNTLVSMVSPITGNQEEAEQPSPQRETMSARRSLSERLTRSGAFGGQVADLGE